MVLYVLLLTSIQNGRPHFLSVASTSMKSSKMPVFALRVGSRQVKYKAVVVVVMFAAAGI